MKYNPEKMMDFAARVGCAAGMSQAEAGVFAESLVYANMRGLDSHGLMRMGAYLRRIHEGFLAVGAMPAVTRDAGSLVAVDGGNGLGMCVARTVMEMCVERARQTGVCIAAVRNCNHFGYAAYVTKLAVERHMIGLAVTNSPKAVAPFGGAQAMLGTNPISVAVPTGDGMPFVMDMATSLVAQGKVILARKEGRMVPEGWGVDEEGCATTDPGAILDGGTLLPFGGPKGYALSLMIELLCVSLAGAAKSTEMGSMYHDGRKQGTGFLLGAVNVDSIVDAREFERSASGLLHEIKASKKSRDTKEILIPGEMEELRFRRAVEEGIELSDAVVDELRSVGALYHVPLAL